MSRLERLEKEQLELKARLFVLFNEIEQGKLKRFINRR